MTGGCSGETSNTGSGNKLRTIWEKAAVYSYDLSQSDRSKQDLQRRAAPQCPCNHCHYEQNDEHKEQNLCDASRCARDTAKAQSSSDECYNEEGKCPAKHGVLHL